MQTILHDIYLRVPLLPRKEKEMLSLAIQGLMIGILHHIPVTSD